MERVKISGRRAFSFSGLGVGDNRYLAGGFLNMARTRGMETNYGLGMSTPPSVINLDPSVQLKHQSSGPLFTFYGILFIPLFEGRLSGSAQEFR
ncbi:hypothetical protein PM082_007539 [Marasmius tenuissimus]|nr:hypothetical protein PM082_007539 [Marasmius tenuissimus]